MWSWHFTTRPPPNISWLFCMRKIDNRQAPLNHPKVPKTHPIIPSPDPSTFATINPLSINLCSLGPKFLSTIYGSTPLLCVIMSFFSHQSAEAIVWAHLECLTVCHLWPNAASAGWLQPNGISRRYQKINNNGCSNNDNGMQQDWQQYW